ncbi:hypothetical protein DMNBHIDG_01442 [Candidatus Methanoperedenaceae archaeon GB37]|nr:hypothetical protein DMNBHIDG_01442 [Candidatus Methanoperedenaceae archaeon GB37]
MYWLTINIGLKLTGRKFNRRKEIATQKEEN